MLRNITNVLRINVIGMKIAARAFVKLWNVCNIFPYVIVPTYFPYNFVRFFLTVGHLEIADNVSVSVGYSFTFTEGHVRTVRSSSDVRL